MIGVIDTLLTTIANMSEEDKREALVETGKIAEAAFDRRTEIMKGEVAATNSKLEEFIQTYRENLEKQEENSTKE